MNISMKNDLIEGPIFRSLVIFALPIFFSNIFQQLYNTVDTMIVGHFLGDCSLAAIGACSSIYELMIGFGLGVGSGLAIVTARSYGSSDEYLLKKSVASAIVIGIVVSLSITLLAAVILMPLLQVLNTPAEIIEQSYSYINVITRFTIVMFAYNLCAGLLRAIGNSFMPLMFLIFSSMINIVLDYYFIVFMHMGIKGAAVATVISQALSVILCLFYIYYRAKILLVKKEHFVFDKGIYLEMIGQGLSMGFMSSIVSCGSVILQYGINGLGTLVIAGHSAARKLFFFFSMPLASMANALVTFVSQNKGANKVERIIKGMKISYLYSLVVTILIVILSMLFAKDMVRLLSGSTSDIVIDNGALYLQIGAPFYFVLGMLINTRNSLQALGSKIMPLVSSIIELVGKIIFVIVFIPKYQYYAVILCEPVIWCVMCIQLLWVFWQYPYIKNYVK